MVFSNGAGTQNCAYPLQKLCRREKSNNDRPTAQHAARAFDGLDDGAGKESGKVPGKASSKVPRSRCGAGNPPASRREEQAMSNTTTVTGNLTRDPEVRYTREGHANVQLGLAVHRRWMDRDSKEWEESTSFFDVVCWRDLAENAALSLGKGMRVMVTGRLEQRSWETDQGERRSKVEIVAEEIGVSLRFTTATVARNDRTGGPSADEPGMGTAGADPADGDPAQGSSGNGGSANGGAAAENHPSEAAPVGSSRSASRRAGTAGE